MQFSDFLLDVFNKVFYPVFDLGLKYYLDHPMFKIALAFVPAILGISYPLIIDTAGKLDGKYNSRHINKLFKEERTHKIFVFLLKVSVVLSLLSVTIIPAFYFLSFLSTAVLLVFFFKYVSLLMRYQNGEDLFLNILSKSKKQYSDNIELKKPLLWKCAVELFNYSIHNNNRELSEDISYKYIIRVFDEFAMKNSSNESLKYPDLLYTSSHDLIKNYLKSEKEINISVAVSLIGSLFYYKRKIDSFHNIPERSYATIWRNLLQVVEYRDKELLIEYWQRSHQFSWHNFFRIGQIQENKSKENALKVLNSKRDFFHLHIALGAVVYHNKMYDVIEEFWFYTQTFPVAYYYLIPQNINDIFQYFFDFSAYRHEGRFKTQYYFNDLSFEDFFNKRDSKSVIREYVVLLFLRLYKIESYSSSHPLKTIPIFEISGWQHKLEEFKKILEKLLDDKLLLENLKLDTNTIETSCKKYEIDTPFDYIKKVISNQDNREQRQLDEEELSQKKKEKIEKGSVPKIKNYLERIKKLSQDNSECKLSSDTIEYINKLTGTRTLFNKDTLIENSKIPHLNYDTILGEMNESLLIEKFSMIMAKVDKTEIYEIPKGKTFSAIDKLVSKKRNEFEIISFLPNLSSYEYSYDVEGLEISDNGQDISYKSSKVHSFPEYHRHVDGKTFVIRKEDMPCFKSADWEELIEKGLLESERAFWEETDNKIVDNEYKIRISYKELNDHPDLKEAYMAVRGRTEEELKNKVDVYIIFYAYCWFIKGAKIYEISEAEEFQEGGNIVAIDDIQPIA